MNRPLSTRSLRSRLRDRARRIRQSRTAIDTRSSLPAVRAVGKRLAPHEDFYHWVLTLSWLAFVGWVTVAYLVTNALFGLAYWVFSDSVSNAHSLSDCFFFSVQTFATIGYGVMAPQGVIAHVLVTIEALAGIVATASITGITFARLAKPTAKILFSKAMVIAERDGVPHLQFRLANWRTNQIVEAKLHMLMLLTEVTREGETLRRPTPLALVRDVNPMFTLTWLALHPINAQSPLFGGSEALARLRTMNAEIFVTLTGFDESLSQTIHARYRYKLDDIVVNARFADILTIQQDGTRVIDFDKFHDIEHVDNKA